MLRVVRKILDRRLLLQSEVKDLLEQREKRGELTYTQRVTLDYVLRFSKLPTEKAKEIASILINKFGIDSETAYQVVNVLPTTVDELSVFLGGLKLFSDEDLIKIVEIIKSYAPSEGS